MVHGFVLAAAAWAVSIITGSSIKKKSSCPLKNALYATYSDCISPKTGCAFFIISDVILVQYKKYNSVQYWHIISEYDVIILNKSSKF